MKNNLKKGVFIQNSRRMKIWSEIMTLENRKIIENWWNQKLDNYSNNKTDKPLGSPVKGGREGSEIINIRNEERCTIRKVTDAMKLHLEDTTTYMTRE